MKRIFSLLLAAVSLLSYTIAQPVFQKTYLSSASVEGIFAGSASGGGIIVCGRTSSTPYDAMLMKTDASGAFQWAKTYGGTGNDVLKVARPTTDGGYIAVGYTESYGAGNKDVLLIKLDASGVVTWTKTYGTTDNDWGLDVIQTTDGGYALIGSAKNAAVTTQGSIYVIKTNSTGTITWSNMWGNQIGNEGVSIIQTSDGGFLCAGRASNGFNSLIKTTSTGTISWARANNATTLQSVNNQQTILASDGGFVMVGQGSSVSNDWMISLTKTNATGVVAWTKTYTTPSTFAVNFGGGVLQASDGSYLIAAQSEDSPSGLLLLKVSSAGVIVSSKTSTNVGHQEYDVLRFAKTSDNGFVAASGYNGVFLMKCDGNGVTGCTTTTATVTEATPTFNDVAITNWTNSGTTTTNSPTLTGTTITATTTTLCTGTGVEETVVNNMISVVPNPSTGKFIINLDKLNPTDDNNFIEVYNMLGENVYTLNINHIQSSIEVDLTAQPKGIYLVKVNKGREIGTAKIVIQ